MAAALATATPIRVFVLTVRAKGLHDQWKTIRLGKVRRHIEAWAGEHRLDLDLSTERGQEEYDRYMREFLGLE